MSLTILFQQILSLKSPLSGDDNIYNDNDDYDVNDDDHRYPYCLSFLSLLDKDNIGRCCDQDQIPHNIPVLFHF